LQKKWSQGETVARMQGNGIRDQLAITSRIPLRLHPGYLLPFRTVWRRTHGASFLWARNTKITG
jgi:hypothetical protein